MKTDSKNSIDPFSDYNDIIIENAPDKIDIKEVNKGVRIEYFYGILALFAGIFVCIAGGVLLILGIVSKSDVVFKLIGVESKLTDAPAGVVLFIVGLTVIFITKPKVKIKYHDRK